MKFKIFCVLIIAASIAIILGLALTGKEEQVPGQTQTVEQEDVRPRTPPERPMLPENVVPQESADRKKATMELTGTNDPAQRKPAFDRVDMVKMSVDSPSLFGSLTIRDRVAAVSVALNMNEEQEVMLSSYLEARSSFTKSRETTDFASGILNAGRIQGNPMGSHARPEMTLDQMTNIVNIMAQELKEVEALRAAFLNELTKQQREKFDSLPISSSL